MKDNLINILNTCLVKLPNSKFNVTVNYEPIIEHFRARSLNEKNIVFVSDKLDKIEEIKSFNITCEVRRGAGDKYDEEEEPIFEDNWKSTKFIFHGGWDEKEDEGLKDKNTACFSFERLGDETFNSYEKKWFRHYDREEEKVIYYTLFEFSKIEETLDNLIELDNLLDKQHLERKVIADRLVNAAKTLIK